MLSFKDYSLVQAVIVYTSDAHKIKSEQYISCTQAILSCTTKAYGAFNIEPTRKKRQVNFIISLFYT